MLNIQKEDNKNNKNYLPLQTEPNSFSHKKDQILSENLGEKNRPYNKFKLGELTPLKTNEKFVKTGNNIFYLNTHTSYGRNKRKNHIIKLKNNMLFNKSIPGCSPYDPYLIKVCKKAIINRKDQLPNYKEVIKKINTQFGIEKDNDYLYLKNNNKLKKTFNTFSEFQTNYTKGNNALKKENKINSEIKTIEGLENNQK